jgi:hypothetical protein
VLGIDGSGTPTWSCAASNANSWACSSDRNLKENFQPVDVAGVLHRVAGLPLYLWNAKGTDPNVKHLGPTAVRRGAFQRVSKATERKVHHHNVDSRVSAMI